MSQAVTGYITTAEKQLRIALHEGKPNYDRLQIPDVLPESEVNFYAVEADRRKPEQATKIGELTLEAGAEKPDTFAVNGGLEPNAIDLYGRKGIMTKAAQVLAAKVVEVSESATITLAVDRADVPAIELAQKLGAEFNAVADPDQPYRVLGMTALELAEASHG